MLLVADEVTRDREYCVGRRGQGWLYKFRKADASKDWGVWI